MSNTFSQGNSTLKTPSLSSETELDMELNSLSDTSSMVSYWSIEQKLIDDTSQNGDMLPKSFIQLKGIMVGIFNMGCNFHISSALQIKILAIQEHTTWSRTLLQHEITSIERLCNKWGYFVVISKLQILIMDKQLLACHHETSTHMEGRIITSHFQIDERQFVIFIAVYGIPHSGNNTVHSNLMNLEENEVLQEMRHIKEILKTITKKVSRTKDIIYVMGDLQETPDNYKIFHCDRCRIPKHPLGIIKTCEELGLSCNIYQHMETLERPIVSRHGLKGGRFIDGMFACQQGLEK